MTMTNSSMTRRARRAALAVTVLAASGGCTLDATNPGPIQAEALNNAGALGSLVSGAGRDLAEALNWTSYTGAAASRELHPAGSTAAFGISVRQQQGILAEDENDTWWNFAQRARWTSEDVVARAKSVLGANASKSAQLAQALVWAGYANRHLGENFCEGVINGGAPGPHTVYFERAEANFTEAITVAQAAGNTTLATAATAGRASVRLLRNNTAGAVADAAGVANTFTYKMPYYQNELDQYNRIYWAGANAPYRAHTVWNTVYDSIRKATRDPRVPFDSSLTVLTGDAAVGNLGRVRWYFQTKYADRTAAITLSSGWEMRLIEAEVKLINGDWQGAMTTINARRANLNLPLYNVTNATDAWAMLKRERGTELWLEARRLGDLRRWQAANRPGALHPLEILPNRDLCFNTPLSEKQTNPNY